jgi:flagellar hook-associated protein 3 FlgL
VNARLSAEETTLSNASDILIRVKELSIQAYTDTMSSTSRQAVGAELQGLRNQLLSLANTQDSNGNYLFAGSRVGQPAFATDGVYQGDETRMNAVVGEQRTIPINRSGSEAFVRVVRTDEDGSSTGIGFFESLDDLIKAVKGLSGTDSSEAMKRGAGEVDSLLQGVLLAQANVGTDMRVVEQQQNVVEETTLNLTTTLSNIEDLDYAQAITKMKKQMLALEATQSSFAQISQLSLFNFIK